MALTRDALLRAISNKGRYHDLNEIQLTLKDLGYPSSEHEITAELKKMIREELVEEEAEAGLTGYCLTEKAKVPA
jgi:hypothetical protein